MANHTTEEHALELFENLRAISEESPHPAVELGRRDADDAAYEGRGHYERVMAAGIEIEVEWSCERLA